MATDAAEIAIISVLAAVALVCLVIVVCLVRWLKKVALTTGFGENNDSDSEAGDVVTVWEAGEGVGGSARKLIGTAGAASTHDPLDGPGPTGEGRASPAGACKPMHPVPQGTTLNAMFGEEPSKDRDDVIIPKPREGGITFGFYRTVQGRKVNKSAFLSKSDVLQGLGIVLKGDAPVSICEVERGGPAWNAGLRLDDFMTSVNGVPCIKLSHKAVIALVTKALQQVQSSGSPDRRATGGGYQATSMVVTAQDAMPDAALSDVNASPQGQAHGDEVTGVGSGGAAADENDDPFAPLREAAIRHQLEAARLMQTGNFKQARILLDRAIGLLQSIPKKWRGRPS